MSDVVLRARDLKKHYNVGGGLFKSPNIVKALDGVSFELKRNKTLAVVGESGCGKSTLARLVTMIEEPTEGSLQIKDTELAGASAEARKALRPKVQIVFQNPYGSLNPRQKIGDALTEPLSMNTDLPKAEKRDRAKDMMAAVGLRPEHYDRYPHMFSGGQRQRIAIARALMLDPEILVLDEPVSALDVSIQAQVLNVLSELQEKLNLAYLFISHDLSVVKHIADDVMVMYLGKPVEKASREELFSDPRHPYTRALLSATPIPDPTREKTREVLKGELPSPINPPTGCAFHPRCPKVFDPCASKTPLLVGPGSRKVACHLYND
ncbi:ABC transporter ATP-binding protein [Ahrensia kielensis]|uniref:ABC transporter ATP-binding protein n=1 Tax=Ahrensia kielensis TaxID=76980 RepID=UPI00036B9E86|nr:dipeptide ABC transporter ATP-binding protein [Ahrensia kielensis]